MRYNQAGASQCGPSCENDPQTRLPPLPPILIFRHICGARKRSTFLGPSTRSNRGQMARPETSTKGVLGRTGPAHARKPIPHDSQEMRLFSRTRRELFHSSIATEMQNPRDLREAALEHQSSAKPASLGFRLCRPISSWTNIPSRCAPQSSPMGHAYLFFNSQVSMPNRLLWRSMAGTIARPSYLRICGVATWSRKTGYERWPRKVLYPQGVCTQRLISRNLYNRRPGHVGGGKRSEIEKRLLSEQSVVNQSSSEHCMIGNKL